MRNAVRENFFHFSSLSATELCAVLVQSARDAQRVLRLESRPYSP